MSNPIVLAIPAFFILIGVEILVGWRRRRTDYRFNDAITSLNLGVGSQVVDALQVGASLAVYAWLYDRTAQLDMPTNAVWVWVVAFIVQDFLYYWFHRLSHEVGFLWAAHVVHHQSEAFNLSTALRQSWIQSMFSSVFYLPMAVLGVPTLVYATVRALNTLYQFWIHTEHIGRMGPFEWLFNTPSHHRVHHGVDDQYIDRNHAGLFIIWDKMFGTFEPAGDHP
ncbi:MAG: sterol desaturase family protein, partial [Myxococcales bacterium]|nr:sterol desaturase family protein [Myxococcales bacterium]